MQRAKAGEIEGTGYDSASRMKNVTSHLLMTGFHYVYILESERLPGHFYTGLTEDLADRLRRHNSGDVPHTAKFGPWKIKTAVAFRERESAVAFERYLKTASGRAFAKKRL